MQTILRAYKYRLSPNKTQTTYLCKNFGAVRFLRNKFVASFNSFNKGPCLPQDEKIIKDMEGHEWMHDCISYALQQTRMDWVEFKKQYFNKKRKVKLGRPQFKKKGRSRDSFRIPGQQFTKGQVNLESGTIKLPKMDPMKMIVDRKFHGTVKSVTVSRNICDQYFVSVLVEESVELKQNTGRSVGIDLGLKELCVLSNGMKIENPRLFRKTQAKLRNAQKSVSRKVIGSNRREKAKMRVARLHLKIANQRKYIHNVLSTWLVENFDTIIFEDLNVKGIKNNRRLSKSISDAAWSTLVGLIQYKANWYGKTFHKIDRWYPSSKTCSCCGHRVSKEEMHLGIREWECPHCGTIHDRDLNAAVNVLHEGLRDLYGFTSEELSDYKRGESLRPEAMPPKADSVKRLVSFIEFDRAT